MRVFFAADLHLSPTHRYFHANWDRFVEIANRESPDLVILGGDLSFNGADVEADLVFAAEQIRRIEAPVRVLAGNHDVGDRPDSKKLKQPIDARRLARFRRHFPEDCWHIRADGAHLLGINSELLQVDLPETAVQWKWLASVVREVTAGASPAGGPAAAASSRLPQSGPPATGLPRRGTSPVILFTHRPLFEVDIAETSIVGSGVDPTARDRLRSLLAPAPPAIVVSAHVHVYRNSTFAGTEYVWAPALAFVSTHRGKQTYGGVPSTGYLEITTTPPAWRLVRPPLFVANDMRNWFETNKSTITLPPYDGET